MHVKVSGFTALLCMLLIVIASGCNGAGTPTNQDKGATASPSPTKDGDKTVKPGTLASEWAEVRKNYPKLALEHLKLKEALSDGVLFARKVDEKAYKASDFGKMVAAVCLDASRNWVACAPTLEAPVLKQCPRCNACSVPGADVDCDKCLQSKADAGCF